MVTEITELQLTIKDWASIQPTWCPGCGDFAVLNAVKNSFVELQLQPHETVVVSGIGCSSNLPHFVAGYGLHTLHGRAIPVAEGVKLANPDLNVVVTGGDGDGLAIGIGGFLHGARRNMNLTYIVMDNAVYGLTVNQASPTSGLGRKTRSTPYGNIEPPFNPITLALAAGATFVARTSSGDKNHFAEILSEAIKHKGFAFIDDMSPCVTFNKVNTFDFFKERVYKLEETDHDPSNYQEAMLKSFEWGDKIPIGIIYQNKNVLTYEEQDPTITKFGSVVRRGAEKDIDALKNILKDFV
ncbi:MAG: 2-oxoacid:ferredoxin oxidoreductase subunit beta [Candidatus Heimdallarchaeota archaeon]|nr:2-oxoacid:ferredoxin oxidoreductase subunit beta [Candidatus Heimdallarchaeota archaeon]MDH5645281.1 2-oxoacid:ferredoxin oxidoreductase subunit beta [Candidatus Heimdallarchaeota archaeon]